MPGALLFCAGSRSSTWQQRLRRALLSKVKIGGNSCDSTWESFYFL